MKHTARVLLIFTVAALAAVLVHANGERVLWLDFDMKDIAEPKERGVGYYEAFFTAQMTEQWKQAVDVPRWIRAAVGRKKGAANVNAVDEVPNSSWYTNRHHLRPMSRDELIRGPNSGPPPDFTNAQITKAKTEGVTPGLQVKDSRGDSWLIKFDNVEYPELQSGAEVISTKILYAAGYNVPENYISYIDPDKLQIAADFESGDDKRKFSKEDLTRMLEKAARRPDGRYRVLASKMLSGKPKGPFAQVGLRADDPNDLIPHEHRRELRGLRVIASWINHWDAKETNSLDVYVEEDGRRFLRHYLIDFGSTLGGGKHPMEYFHGRELALDAGNITKEILTLGFYVSPSEKEASLILPQVGIFSSTDFDPDGWTPSFPVMPFDNMTEEDAFWATRVILSFSEPELLSIVETAEYSDPRATQYIFRTLLERRRTIASHWMEDVSPLANFAVRQNGAGKPALVFDDLMVKHGLAGSTSTEYTYQIKARGYRSEKNVTVDPSIVLNERVESPLEIAIWTNREGGSSDVVKVYVENLPGGGLGIVRIARG